MRPHPWRRPALTVLGLIAVLATATFARDDPADIAPEERREQQVMERFLSLLEKAPRRGTALDRVYGYHVERGTLDSFIQKYQDRVDKEPKDGAAWLLLGLLESQRGRDAAAVESLRKAEETRPDDALPCYYLGQALVLVGRPDDAAEAFERAIARKPPRAELLDIYQALGRVYQRAQRPEKALAVWERLETQFPNDLGVQEEIAAALAEESEPAKALPRYEGLAKKATDPYRRVQFKLEAAELKVRLGRRPEAIKDFETLLGQLNPDSWLYREVRRKVEEVFLKADDAAGLAAYYEGWLKAHPEDVDAMARIGRVLAGQGRVDDARKWLQQAVTRAPTRRELRLALIDQLVADREFTEAAAQYEAMAKADPSNPDTIRAWGQLLLRDTSKPEAERKKSAASVWRKLVDARPKDAATAVQVADLLRKAELTDDAIALYRKAIALAADAPQYREYLGEYYHALKRPDDAIATWREMAAGKNRNAKNLGRLAEVLAGFGYRKEALGAITDACTIEPDDFELSFKRAVLLHQDERFADALLQLESASKLADGDEQADAVVEEQIKDYQAEGSLARRAEAIRTDLTAGNDATAARWRRLARLREAEQKLPDATAAIRKALELNPKSVRSWELLARVAETAGNLGAAADANRKLAEINRPARAEYLKQVAMLESRLGRRDEALKAGRELLAASPGNPESYQFFADLCFQVGQNDEGLDALRRAVRANPNDTRPMLALSATLADQFRTEEAIELLWRAFDKTAELDSKLGIVSQLTALYLQRNQFDRLVGRLDLLAREPNTGRDANLCLAQAHAAAGDYGTARGVLEKLLAANARDTGLLGQLSALAEVEGDYALAARYQKQLQDLAPSDDGLSRLAQLYTRAGEPEEAEAIWNRLAADDQERGRVLQAMDQLARQDRPEMVVGIAERQLARDAGDWELLLREALALLDLRDRDADASRRFRELLALRIDDDEPSTEAKSRRKGSAASRSVGLSIARGSLPGDIPLNDRTEAVAAIRVAVGLDGRQNFAGPGWSPADFGQARMAALAGMLQLAQKGNRSTEFLKEGEAARARAATDPRPWWEYFYLQLVRNDRHQTYAAARELADTFPGDAAAQWAFLSMLPYRVEGRYQAPVWGRLPETGDANIPALPEAELEAVLKAHRTLRGRRPEWVTADILTNVADELRRADREAEARVLYKESIDSADRVDSINGAMQLTAERSDVDGCLALFDKYERLLGNQPKAVIPGIADPLDALSKLMAVRAMEDALPDNLKILDRYLEILRRRERPGAGRTQARVPIFTSNWSNGNTYSAWLGPNQTHIQIDYPAPNDHFDYGAIMLLRNAFEYYRRADRLPELLTHVRDQLPEADKDGRIGPRLALGYLLWWSEEKEEAIAELERVATQTGDVGLRLDLAELRERQGERAEALELADSVEPLDQKMMQRREDLALRVAVATGDVARARAAAERLFNLRLDTTTQLRLSAQMHQLGMHELAEAVLGRARHRAGNRTASLLALMHQYQQQNQPDRATQVAHQILRRSPIGSPSAAFGQNTPEDQARAQAIALLAQSGRLKEMIARLEEQVESSPNSVALLDNLGDYYRAAGEKDKFTDVQRRIVAARPDDLKLRYQVARKLLGVGERDAALEQYKAALALRPDSLANYFNEIQQAFAQANKFGEMLDAVAELDLGSLGGSTYLASNLVQIAFGQEPLKDRGLALFRKAWAALPDQRVALLNTVNDEALWRLPEMFDHARDVLIPTPESTLTSPWLGVDVIQGYTPDGRILTQAARLLDAAERQGKLDDLDRTIAEALKAHPDWEGGKALRLIILARKGKVDAARDGVLALIEAHGGDRKPIPPFVAWAIGQEFEDAPGARDLALALYESTIHNPGDDIETPYQQFQYSPAHRLFLLYCRDGRDDDAYDLVRRYTRSKVDDRRASRFGQAINLNQVNDGAQQFLALGYPAEAVRAYTAPLADPALVRTIPSNQVSWLEQNAAAMTGRAVQSLDDDLKLARTLAGFVRPAEDRPGAPTIDLALTIQQGDLRNARIRSLFAEAVASPRATREQLTAARDALAALAPRDPAGLSLPIARALVALALDDARGIEEALAGLHAAIDAAPLPDAAGRRSSATERAEARRQLAIWLVARACWAHRGSGAAGDALASRALRAADRIDGRTWPVAMLRERGQIALDLGDRDEAARRWGHLLDYILADPRDRPSAADPRPRPEVERPAPLPLDRFNEAMLVARLALDYGMPALSLRAARQSLRGGAPVGVETNNANPVFSTIRRVRHASPFGGTSYTMAYAPMATRGVSFDDVQAVGGNVVETQLTSFERDWRRLGVADAEIYELLRDTVLPESRPAEAFLYARPLAPVVAGRDPYSLGLLLVRVAVRAGRAEELRSRLEARRDRPMAALPVLVMLVRLGIEVGDVGLVSEALDAFRQRLAKDTLNNSAELACHAALPALHTDAAPVARAVVEAAARNLGAVQGGEPAAGLMIVLAGEAYRRNDPATARDRLKDVIDLTEKATAQNVNAAPIQRRQALYRIATESAHAADLVGALDALGQYADLPSPPNDQTDPGAAVLPALRMLAALPARDRFDRLRAWTMPTASRRTVRIVATPRPLDTPPTAFGVAELDGGGPGLVAGTAGLLIDAARTAGQLDALAEEVARAAEAHVDGADALLLLVELARGRSVADGLARFRGAIVKDQPKAEAEPVASAPMPGVFIASLSVAQPVGDVDPTINRIPQWTDLLVAEAALQGDGPRGEVVTILRAVVDQARRHNLGLFQSIAQHDLARAEVAVAGGSPGSIAGGPGLRRWSPSGFANPWASASGNPPGTWTEQDGAILHIAGPDEDFLDLDVPLGGAFSFSFDAHHAGASSPGLAFGGYAFQDLINQIDIGTVGQVERIQQARPVPRREGKSRWTLQVEPGRLRLLIDGHLAHDEPDLSPTSPWLSLFSRSTSRSVWSNLRLEGTPEIPESIALVQGDRLEGWVSIHYGESLPSRRTRLQQLAAGIAAESRDATELYDWSANDGILQGRRVDASSEAEAEAVPSRLFYRRPLRDGETLTYEFLYEPNAVEVQPTLGRVAFVLDPGGVRLHWLTDGPAADWTGLGTDNVAEVPGDRRGAAPLPLKAGDWNRVEIRLAGDAATLSLNGQEIYTLPLRPEDGREFGLFHDKDRTAARVRNVVLAGPWRAMAAGLLDNLLAGDVGKPDAADRRARAALIGPEFFALEALEVARRAESLPPAERFDLLARWVLPGDDHADIRLFAEPTPTDPAPPVADDPPVLPAPAVRVHSGGVLKVPAILLVDSAKQAGRLDDLAARVEAIEPADDDDRRGQRALRALVRIVQGKDDEARALFRETIEALKSLPLELPIHRRWPELAAPLAALDRPSLVADARAVLDALVDRVQKKGENDRWEHHVRHARALADVRLLPEPLRVPFGTPPPSAEWTPVFTGRAESRGRGEPIAHWSIADRTATHFPGHQFDYLYYHVPLRGDFELECELSAFGWREARISYGGVWVGVLSERNRYELGHHGRFSPQGIIDPPLPDLGDWYRYRLVVKDGSYTAYINDRKVHEQRLPAEPDPWLSVYVYSNFTGGVRNLRIKGKPTVPDRLNLTAGNDLGGWMAEYYAEPVGEGGHWSKRGEEIVGRCIVPETNAEPDFNPYGRANNNPIPLRGSKQESLLQYHRPMLEDGEISFEYYYDPEKAAVDPALDRLVLRLDPEGVKIHWLTDAQHDRTGLSPANETTEPDHRRGADRLPLRPKDWNEVTLALKGDLLTLTLNDNVIYERPLERTNLRVFGLFHYADETESRVRKVTYRGDWPKSLPASQELAPPDGPRANP